MSSFGRLDKLRLGSEHGEIMGPTDRFRLDGLTALVIGVGPAIGQAVARSFASAGARTVITARSEGIVARLAETINGDGFECEWVSGDITDADARDRLVEATGAVDIVFFNAYALDAGIKPTFELNHPFEATEADWRTCFETNMLAPFEIAKALLPGMQARGGGNFIHCVAAAAFTPILPAMAYGATKAGLMTMTRYLARAYGPTIRFNAIAPSNIENQGRPASLVALSSQSPLARMGLPEDVAAAALYLASDASAFVTGEVIHVDGGRVTTR